MSRFWSSESKLRSLGLALGALALAAFTVVALVEAFPGAAQARTTTRIVRVKGDSVKKVVHRVETGPGGVVIEGESEDEDRGTRGTDVRIGPGGVHIETDADSESGVNVDMPGIHVHGGRSGGSDAVVRAFTDIRVAPGETVDGDVVALCGSVTVEGHVEGDVVAVGGSVRMKPGAVVDGSAVAIGGLLDQPEGARVGDQAVSLGFLPLSFGLPTLPILLLTVLLGWLLTVFMSWLLTMLFPERLQRVASTVSRNPAGSFFLGIVSLPMLVVLALLLSVTVIGLPLALLLPLFYLLAVWAGQIAATYLLGCRILRRNAGETPIFGPAVAGSLFVALFFVVGAVIGTPSSMVMRSLGLFFTLLGLLLVTGLSILGTGAFLVSRAGGRPRAPRSELAAAPVVSGPLPTPPPATS